jgi:hypothetical protein
MTDHESHSRRPSEPPPPEPQDSRVRESTELRAEHSQLRKLAEVIRLADFMAILMVLATLFSAFATWRTAQVTRLVFEIADRPFLGVQKVSFEAIESERPMITVEVRDFANIPALEALVSVYAVADGKPLAPPPGEMTTQELGILSPGVPHHFYAFITPELYRAASAGKSNLQVHVRMLYKGPAHQQSYCYFERVVYDFHAASFRMSGGSDRCGTDVF